MNETRKPHSNSVIAKMTQAQRDTLEDWLFEENLSYAKTIQKAKADFNVTLNRDNLSTYYHQTAQERNLEHILQSSRNARTLIESFAEDSEKTYRALLNFAGQLVFDIISSTKPGQKPNLAPLHNTLQLLISARKGDREDRKQSLEREMWEIDVARLCAKHHAELDAIAKDESLDEQDRLQSIRRSLFGEIPQNQLPSPA